ncbi:MAG: precorrin-6A reductase, partial [Oscillospiraceae bacterium]|nr:precorrin-6A reductase [Oscillospiraceae bacterium]
MYKFCIFAGTTEGRELAEFLLSQGAAVTACVATEYGQALLPPAEGLSVRAGRMDRRDMAALLSGERFDLVLDATHPYAAEATENIAAACAGTGTEYVRVLREDSRPEGGALYFPDIPALVEYLNLRPGNILLTTGSKELGAFAAMADFTARVWARVLPTEGSIAACRASGLAPSHILGMQGPFSSELNAALLRSVGAAFLVTKDGGGAGGFAEKAEAARETGAALLVLGRPPQREGKPLPEVYALLGERFGFRRRVKVTVAGIGPGGAAGMTAE